MIIKKNIQIVVLLSLLFSCTKSVPKNYASLSGKVENAKSSELIIRSRAGYVKKIKLNGDGTFSDTLHLKERGELFMFSIDGTSQIFLKNNDDIVMSVDTNKFNETLNFSGKGAETSKYLAEKILLQSKFSTAKLFELDKDSYNTKIKELSGAFKHLLNKYQDIDTVFYSKENKYIKTLPELLMKQYHQINNQKNKYAHLKGKPSPEFINYENYKGGTTSLKELNGKYIYIDVWATWCRPCLGEIPHLKKLEEEFKDENIVFVSISIDKETSKANWRKMITEKKMGGIQLFAPKNAKFIKSYKIKSIPRFILIDPNGNVVDANMPRPSNTKTKEILTKLLK
jgi:thiol-disulfide isomerase/thioredoxin